MLSLLILPSKQGGTRAEPGRAAIDGAMITVATVSHRPAHGALYRAEEHGPTVGLCHSQQREPTTPLRSGPG
jgi:hypothetical protein